MALIVADGTGLDSANAYIDVAYLDDYAALRGTDLTAYDTAAKEAAIITCTIDFIDIYYDFRGTLVNESQSLSLPTDLVTINKDIKSAAANGAILQLKGLLLVDTSLIGQAGIVKSESKKLAKLETETEYFEGSTSNYKRDSPLIDKLLSKYLSFSSSARLVVT